MSIMCLSRDSAGNLCWHCVDMKTTGPQLYLQGASHTSVHWNLLLLDKGAVPHLLIKNEHARPIADKIELIDH